MGSLDMGHAMTVGFSKTEMLRPFFRNFRLWRLPTLLYNIS